MRKKLWSTTSSEHDIVETGSGRLVDEQRLTGMNDKLNAAHDETLKAKARFDQFSVVKGMEVPSAAASGSDAHTALSDFLDKLRSQYLDIVSKEAESSARLGPNNPAIISLRNQKIQLRSEIAEEIQRLKDASESDYAAAQLRESTLKKEFDAGCDAESTGEPGASEIAGTGSLSTRIPRLIQYIHHVATTLRFSRRRRRSRKRASLHLLRRLLKETIRRLFRSQRSFRSERSRSDSASPCCVRCWAGASF